MRLNDLVACSNQVASVSSRNEKIAALADLLRRLDPEDELRVAVAFLTGKLPQGRIGLGPNAVQAARPGGGAAEGSLSVLDAHRAFDEIAAISGPGSASARVARLRGLLERATTDEQSFLIGLVYGELHQGAMEGVMVSAVARAAAVPVTAVRRALMTEGDLATVSVTAFREGETGLSRSAVRLFRPIKPMLAQPASSSGDALARIDDASAEFKVDGARIQVHKDGDEVRVYSRRLRDVTPAVPEVVEAVRAWPARQVIVDGEVIALREDERPHPFQVTMRRFGRKLDVAAMRHALPLTPFLFDLLLVDGTATIDEPLATRFDLLHEQAGQLVVPRRVVASDAEADDLLTQAVAAGHEGLMIKALDSTYAAGGRGAAWLKLKPSETLDLVVLAAEWGHGRRSGWLSNLHLGALDPATGGFVMLGKTFKGLTDRMLEWQTKELLARELGRDQYTVHVKPELVAEIAFNEVQASRRYPGGVALRFARVKRYRNDKPASEADTIHTVRAIHERTAG